jgi:hypothetical protein
MLQHNQNPCSQNLCAIKKSGTGGALALQKERHSVRCSGKMRESSFLAAHKLLLCAVGILRTAISQDS